jgi:glycine reductase
MDLTGKRVIAIGERDGVQSEAIAACARAGGASILMQQTHCFV